MDARGSQAWPMASSAPSMQLLRFKRPLISIEVVQEGLGHASARVNLDAYTHVLAARLRQSSPRLLYQTCSGQPARSFNNR